MRVPRLRVHFTATMNNKLVFVNTVIRIHQETQDADGLIRLCLTEILLIEHPPLDVFHSRLLKPVLRQPLQIIDHKQIYHLPIHNMRYCNGGIL